MKDDVKNLEINEDNAKRLETMKDELIDVYDLREETNSTINRLRMTIFECDMMIRSYLSMISSLEGRDITLDEILNGD